MNNARPTKVRRALAEAGLSVANYGPVQSLAIWELPVRVFSIAASPHSL